MKSVGILGKHPSFGDFVSRGLPPEKREALQTWLTDVFGTVQRENRAAFPQIFDAARPLRFWIGADVFGACLHGIIAPSKDAVGRRYPLSCFSIASDERPPPLLESQEVYDDLEARLIEILASELMDPSQLGGETDLDFSFSTTETSLWAVNATAHSSDLLQAIGTEDYIRAARSRSYWWCEPDDLRSGAVWSCGGLLEADALLWLLSGVETTV